MDYPKFNSSSNKLKASITNKPFSGDFKLITEQEDWQLSDEKDFKIFEAKKVIFALKDTNEMKIDFYFQADNLGFSILYGGLRFCALHTDTFCFQHRHHCTILAARS